MPTPTVFISYSHKDADWKKRLLPHFQQLEKLGLVRVWEDRDIHVGDDWYGRIQQVLDETRFAVCLISADFLNSSFCMDEEIPFLLQKRRKGGLEILPILIRDCLWEPHLWLRGIQMLPRDAKSVQTHFADDPDPVFTEAAKHVWEALQPRYVPPPPPARPGVPPEKEDISRLPETGSLLFGRREEIAMLDAAWTSGSPNVLVFRAWGGVGKSTLMRVWCETMREENYRGAQRVFAWSFYSQGTGERVTSADLFIDTALRWFGDPNPTQGSPWEKGERLAERVRSRRTLLLLDGLEPLQSAQEFDRGSVTDPALQTLLRELAHDGGQSLCVVSTREPVTDLLEYAPGGVRHVDLEQVSLQSGRALLRVAGVGGEDTELEDVVRRFGQHALAINLLGSYLRERGGIAATAEVPELDISENKGRHPRRVIEAWARLLEPGPELDLLKVLGLFDRPAMPQAIAAVLTPPSIPGFTEHLSGRGQRVMDAAVERLRMLQLLDEAGHHDSGAVDCHPLVREHFEARMRAAPAAWTEANRRLFQYHQTQAPDLPATLTAMAPLFAAIRHGCEAGNELDALVDVYARRMHQNKGFLVKHLGAHTTAVALLSHFFQNHWDLPLQSLARPAQTFVLAAAAIALQSIGRLADALPPMERAYALLIEQEAWTNVAPHSDQLASLYIVMGRFIEASQVAESGLDYALKADEQYRHFQLRCTLASILHLTGDIQGAKRAYEAILLEADGSINLISSAVDASRFAGFLIDTGDETAAIEVSLKSLAFAREYMNHTAAYPELSLGQAFLRVASGSGADAAPLQEAGEHIQNALDGFRSGGMVFELPPVLLARAALLRMKAGLPESGGGELDRAQLNVTEALRIATQGQMLLYIADGLLEQARLSLAAAGRAASADEKRKMEEVAHTAWKRALDIVDETGYRCREPDLDQVRAQLESA